MHSLITALALFAASSSVDEIRDAATNGIESVVEYRGSFFLSISDWKVIQSKNGRYYGKLYWGGADTINVNYVQPDLGHQFIMSDYNDMPTFVSLWKLGKATIIFRDESGEKRLKDFLNE